ncbi:unnamed protein product [Citrullus colocynthis]|uniref:Uncharacterized protein n=1 Tax=Citrullus colocynthis TaxID=252529 RepID=A0ABP0YAN4_9ROSI
MAVKTHSSSCCSFRVPAIVVCTGRRLFVHCRSSLSRWQLCLILALPPPPLDDLLPWVWFLPRHPLLFTAAGKVHTLMLPPFPLRFTDRDLKPIFMGAL